ncbi:MAG: YbaB/EbfC family nucleoid-associated protein [Planctomycetota bacterium]|nr:YbaB/EbfC family nucleoid-associated protein [Planctomycetota bacterium]
MKDGGLGMGDIMKLMGQLPKMKENIAQAQERARYRTVVGEADAGLVKVTCNGVGEIVSVTIDPEALKEPDTLGPLIAAAANVALAKSKEAMLEEARNAMGGIELPPGLL